MHKRGFARLAMLSAATALTLGGCVGGRLHPGGSGGTCDTTSIASRPGQIWWHQQRWRYASDADANAAYALIASGDYPYPNWFIPHEEVLAVGTRFQMAIGAGQPETSPGAFGTFDNVRNVREVRLFLAVEYAWKPDPDRVVTYQVTKPLPAKIGPIGPQADPHGCRWLPGRWSQLQMTVPAANRMDYLSVLSVRPIH